MELMKPALKLSLLWLVLCLFLLIFPVFSRIARADDLSRFELAISWELREISSLPTEAKLTHINLNDGTIEGLAYPALKAFSVQYHPESSPGPHDARYLFDQFFTLMSDFKKDHA